MTLWCKFSLASNLPTFSPGGATAARVIEKRKIGPDGETLVAR